MNSNLTMKRTFSIVNGISFFFVKSFQIGLCSGLNYSFFSLAVLEKIRVPPPLWSVGLASLERRKVYPCPWIHSLLNSIACILNCLERRGSL